MQPSTLFLLALLVPFPACAASANNTLVRALGTTAACLSCVVDNYYCWSSSSCTSTLPANCVTSQISAITEDCPAAALTTCSQCTGAGNVWCADDAFCVTTALYCSSSDAALSGASSCPAPSTPSGERGYVLVKTFASTACTGTAAYSVAQFTGCTPMGGGSYARAMCTSTSSAFVRMYSDPFCLQALGNSALTSLPWTCQSGAQGGELATCITGTYSKPRTGLVVSAVTPGTCPIASSSSYTAIM